MKRFKFLNLSAVALIALSAGSVFAADHPMTAPKKSVIAETGVSGSGQTDEMPDETMSGSGKEAQNEKK